MAKSKLSARDRELLREHGRKGGAVRMEKLSPERRSEVAKTAVDARERKRRKRRYELMLPPAGIFQERLKTLEVESPNIAFFVGRIVLDGELPADLAAGLGLTEEEAMQRLNEGIRALNTK